MEGDQISGKEKNQNKETEIEEMFSLRTGLNLEDDKLSWTRSSSLEEE